MNKKWCYAVSRFYCLIPKSMTRKEFGRCKILICRRGSWEDFFSLIADGRLNDNCIEELYKTGVVEFIGGGQ